MLLLNAIEGDPISRIDHLASSRTLQFGIVPDVDVDHESTDQFERPQISLSCALLQVLVCFDKKKPCQSSDVAPVLVLGSFSVF